MSSQMHISAATDSYNYTSSIILNINQVLDLLGVDSALSYNPEINRCSSRPREVIF